MTLKENEDQAHSVKIHIEVDGLNSFQYHSSTTKASS